MRKNFINFVNFLLNYLENSNNYNKVNFFFFILNLLLFFFLFNYIIKIFYLIIFIIFFLFNYIKEFLYFIYKILLGLDNNFNSNFKTDLDASVNTDGEDLIVYINDLVEISLSERSIFFDIILANPFEFSLLFLSTFFISLYLLNSKIKSPISLFKFFKKFK